MKYNMNEIVYLRKTPYSNISNDSLNKVESGKVLAQHIDFNGKVMYGINCINGNYHTEQDLFRTSQDCLTAFKNDMIELKKKIEKQIELIQA